MTRRVRRWPLVPVVSPAAARPHPESLARALRRRGERRLAALAAVLWPHDEYEAEL